MIDLPYNFSQVCAMAVSVFGEDRQKLKAIEEMAELTKAICDMEQERTDTLGLAEEIADVAIMLGQLIMIYECQDAVDQQIEAKVDRLENRINAEVEMLEYQFGDGEEVRF